MKRYCTVRNVCIAIHHSQSIINQIQLLSHERCTTGPSESGQPLENCGVSFAQSRQLLLLLLPQLLQLLLVGEVSLLVPCRRHPSSPSVIHWIRTKSPWAFRVTVPLMWLDFRPSPRLAIPILSFTRVSVFGQIVLGLGTFVVVVVGCWLWVLLFHSLYY